MSKRTACMQLQAGTACNSKLLTKNICLAAAAYCCKAGVLGSTMQSCHFRTNGSVAYNRLWTRKMASSAAADDMTLLMRANLSKILFGFIQDHYSKVIQVRSCPLLSGSLRLQSAMPTPADLCASR